MINTVTKYYFNSEFAGYIVTYKDSNITQAVPKDTKNKDYQDVQEWIADGGTVIDNGGGE